MEHELMLDNADFWREVQQAVTALAGPDPAGYRLPLQAAADRLLAAREVLYPVNIHLLDLCLLDDERRLDGLPATYPKALPVNVLSPAAPLERISRRASES